jgi:exo-1,4-beta-D-glucosaminidase
MRDLSIMTMRKLAAALLIVLVHLASPRARAAPPAPAAKLPLATGWNLQSSAKAQVTGDVVSTARFAPRGWYTTDVPSTVVAALVARKVYPEPFFGMNLRKLPGTTYGIGDDFSNKPMPADSPFASSWWYRKSFTVPAAWAGKTLWLDFRGINYRADIWLNGRKLAGSDDVAGAWRTYEFDVTDLVRPGAANVLALEITAQKETDLGITFVDWNPLPPDKNLGLFREVTLAATGPLAVRHPAVSTKLEGVAKAQLTVNALVKNGTARPVRGIVRARIAQLPQVVLEQPVLLGPGEQKDVTFDPSQFALLTVNEPKLWWPAQMGTPNLYDLHVEVEAEGQPSDAADVKFGIREIKSELNADKKRLFTVNGKKILIRGAGWSSDLMMRFDPARTEDELTYVLDMGLNTVRLEGKLEPDSFFDFTDRHGLLVMAGWCCCDHWEHWKKWKPADHVISAASQRDQLYRLRGHPSLLVWLNGSDGPPPADVEKRYLDVAVEVRWPNPTLSSASDKATTVTGESGVKMSGPYEYVAPRYWVEDSKNGGAYGFNTETSPGPAVPPIESLRKMLPADKLWPINEHWNFHAGGGQFRTLGVFTEALEARYGKAASAEDYAQKSQLMAYEGIRAMFEAYSRNKYTATGVVQWMLNNAWPGMIWHLYDYYMRPGGGYFGAKRATETLHPIYGYDDNAVWVVSSQYEAAPGLKLGVAVYDLTGRELFAKQVTVDAPADSTQKVLALPALKDGGPVTFVRLTLDDAAGKRVGSNFYWLSTKPEVLDYPKSKWFVTPTASFADFTALEKLPPATVKVTSRTERAGEQALTRVTVENPGPALAFFVRLKLAGTAGGEEILPVRWEDNYVSLLPGETRVLTARYRSRALGKGEPVIEVSGWNVRAAARPAR